MFEKALQRSPDHARALIGLAESYRRNKQSEKARATFKRADAAIASLKNGPRTTEAAMSGALYAAVSDKSDEAVAILTDLLKSDRSPSNGWTLPIEPLFAPLRRMPAFRPLLSRLADRAR